MLKKSFFSFVIVLIFIVGANAQTRIGITAGYNLSGVHGVTGIFSGNSSFNHDWSMVSGFQAGIAGEFPLNEAETFYLQAAGTFYSHGFRDTYNQGSPNGSTARRTFKFYGLQVPVNVQYKLKVGIPVIVFQAGPYVDYEMFGRQKYTLNNKDKTSSLSDAQKKLKFEETSNQKIKNRFQYGVGVGAGVQVSRFQVMLGYNYGLSDLAFYKKTGITYDHKLKSNQFFANFTFYFGKYASIFPDIE
ncbi:MAG: PorT family protein [Bacteroidales bacterium]|jgi:hypothetical protein|nr:PorT family protein [Bacteroidales bacterium]